MMLDFGALETLPKPVYRARRVNMVITIRKVGSVAGNRQMTPPIHQKHLLTIAQTLCWLGFGIWMSFIYLTLQYDATRPTVSQPSEDRVYVQNTHGHYVYLNSKEQNNLNYLEAGALAFVLISGLMTYHANHPKRLGEIENEVVTEFYSLSTTAGWYSMGRALRQEGRSIVESAGGIFTVRNTILLQTDKPIDSCRTQLERNVYLNRIVSGDVSGDRIHLFRVRENFRNSFAPRFYGRLEARASGTAIKGRFTLHRFVMVFIGVWFGGIGLVAFLVTPLALRTLFTGLPLVPNPWIGALFPALLFLCGLLMVHWGHRLGRNDKADIVKFFRDTLNARQEILL